MKKSCLYYCFVLFQSVALAQEYKEGKIMLNNNQEKTGLIRVSSLRSWSKGCTFKEPNQDSVFYNSGSLMGFEVSEQRFVKHLFGGAKGTSFVLVLNEGPLSLYQDHEGFYVKSAASSNLLPLIRAEERAISGVFTKVAIFKYQLDSLFRPCPSLSNEALDVAYSTKDLSQIVGKYNRCIDPNTKTAAYTISMPKAVRKIGVRLLGSAVNVNYYAIPNNVDASGNMFGLGVFFSSMGGQVGKGRLGTQVGIDLASYSFGKKLGYNPVYVQIPVLFQYALGATKGPKPFFYVEGGLQGNIQTSAASSSIVGDLGRRNFAFSFPLGVGVQGPLVGGSRFLLSVKYFQITNVDRNRTKTIAFSAGVMF